MNMESTLKNLKTYTKDEQALILKISELDTKITDIGMGLIKEYTCNGLKALLLLNGGAAVAILAFLGNIINSYYEKWLFGMAWRLMFFSLGSFFATIAWLFSYTSQTYYNAATGDTDKITKGDFWRYITILSVIIGGILFLIGGFIIFYVITSY